MNQAQDARGVEFWSSAQYESFMAGLTNSLSQGGTPVRHRFHLSQRAYRRARCPLGRFWLRLRMYAVYPLDLAWHCAVNRRLAARVVCTNTFYAPLVARLTSSADAPVIHLVYDLFPDVLICAGTVSRGGVLARACDRITGSCMRRSASNVFLGNRLLAHAWRRFPTIRNPCVIPVGADGTPFRGFAPKPRAEGRPVTILYCGNLGRMHDVETLRCALRHMRSIGDLRVKFSFHGNGVGMEALRAEFSAIRGALDTAFGSYLSGSPWAGVMKEADVALVTVRPGAEAVMMPSKTYSALVAGQAILAVCPRESDLGDLVREHDCGWLVEPGDVDGLLRTLREIGSDANGLGRKRENAYRCGHNLYDSQVVAKQWRELFASLGIWQEATSA